MQVFGQKFTHIGRFLGLENSPILAAHPLCDPIWECPPWLVVALSGFSLLLMSTLSISPELKQMNKNGNEKCSLLLFVARFGFWGVFPFAFRCFLLLSVARSCF